MAKYPYMNRVVAHSTSANLDSSGVFAGVQEAKCESVFFHIRLPRAALNRFDLDDVQVTFASWHLTGRYCAATNGNAFFTHALAVATQQWVQLRQFFATMNATIAAGLRMPLVAGY